MKSKRKFVVGQECRQLLDDAVAKQAPATLSTQQADQWDIYKSRLLEVRSGRLVLEEPTCQGETPHRELSNGDRLAITFKKGYHKCLFVARVMSRATVELQGGQAAEAIVVAAPEQIEKIQRRAFNRADAPVDEPVLVSLTAAGSDNDEDRLRGVLRNISAGGFAVSMSKSQADQLAEGDQLALHCVPIPHQQPLHVTVRVRHVTDESEDGECIVGLQILGLEMDEDGRRTLRRIGRVVSIYQRQSQMPRTARQHTW